MQSKKICKQVIPDLTNNVRLKAGSFKNMFSGYGFVFVGCSEAEVRNRLHKLVDFILFFIFLHEAISFHIIIIFCTAPQKVFSHMN